MSAKQLLRIVLVLLGAIALWGALAVAKKSRQERPARLVLPVLDSASINRIDIRKGTDSVVLTKSGTSWTVNGWTAASAEMTDWFTALADTNARSDIAAQSEALHQRLGVDSAGRKVVLQAGDKTLATLMVGNRGPDFEGFYVRRLESPEVYLSHARWAEMAGRTADEWRDKQIAKVPADSIKEITVTRASGKFTVVKDGGWKFKAGGSGAPDSAASARFASAFADLRAMAFANPALADTLRRAKPWRTVRVTSAGGSTLLAVALDSTAAGFWLRPDSGSAVYRVDQSVTEAIAPAASALATPKARE
jgi:uncharacterized protein DUF4340